MIEWGKQYANNVLEAALKKVTTHIGFTPALKQLFL